MLTSLRSANSRLCEPIRTVSTRRSYESQTVSFDHVVIGAGVVGLAVAAKLSKHVRSRTELETQIMTTIELASNAEV